MKVVKPLKDAKVKEGESATFTCELNQPDLDGKWTFKGQEITPSDKYKIVSDGCTYTITIDDVSMDDIGKVAFTVQDVSTSANLAVEGKK